MSNFKDPSELKTPDYVRRAIKKDQENIRTKVLQLYPDDAIDAALLEAIKKEGSNNFSPLARKLLREHYQLPPETQ